MQQHARNSVLLLVFLSSYAIGAEICTHDATYTRKDGSYIKVGKPKQSDDGLDRAPFELQSRGNMMPDGAPTVGNLDGELTLTRNSCAGFFSIPEMSCALIVTFSGMRAQAYQIGTCYSGVGAYADGLYIKSKAQQ